MELLKNNGALRVSLIYVLSAGLWITTSDTLVSWAVKDPQVMATISLVKGWLFVGVTAGVLYFSLAREFAYRKKIEADVRQLNTDLERRVEERTARLTEAYAELESFSYSVSHDLRAPLRSIDGFSQIIQEDYAKLLDANGLETLSRIRNASQHMAEIIDALLQLARLTRAELKSERLDLSRMAEEVAKDLAATNPARIVEWIIQPGLSAHGDPAQMRIVLRNLFQNAWKFTARKEVGRIEFSQTTRENEVVFQVSDNGAGFNMAYASKLFEPFQRLHPPADFEGTGIGLTLVQRIIHRHGGRIWAAGVEGQGAVFSFQL